MSEIVKKVILVEFYTWHTECLYSQLLFLTKSGYDVTLVCDCRVKSMVDEFGMDDVKKVFFDFKKRTISSLWKFKRFVIRGKFDNVIIGTASGSYTLKFFLLPLRTRARYTGTIHDTFKLTSDYSSIGQRLICRNLSAYTTLASYLYRPTAKNLNAAWFDPCFYPFVHLEKIRKEPNAVWLAIPGSIEYRRRDYLSLLAIAPLLPTSVKFILLGNAHKADGPDFIRKIKEAMLENRFIFFPGFVPNILFHSYIHQSDYLLPLIHPHTPGAKSYMKYKISGTFPLSQAYHKTMLCHCLFESVEQFTYKAVYYKSEEELANLLVVPQEANRANGADFEANRQRYTSILG